MKPVGYLVKYPDRLEGERGIYYDYVLAGNGLFVEAEGPLMAARVPVAECEVRGLGELETQVVLRYGKIPQRHFDLALNWMLTDRYKERFAAIVWDGEYRVIIPRQAAEKEAVAGGGDEGHGATAAVSYLNPDKVVLELHSHAKMRAAFSGIDNTDETGLKVYGVLGKIDVMPQVLLRVGVYGYRDIVPWSDVFEGHLDGVDDVGLEEMVLGETDKYFLTEEEVKPEDELESADERAPGTAENRSGRMWWHRWLRRGGVVPSHGR
jgi:PRTRC genetic system protein A